MEFFNEIWLKVGEHDYLSITEKTLKKMAAKTFLILRNNANLC